ncbi:MAG: two-component system invasion response regulator UvrY [Paracoccaceae bacterium]|jgi:two-component system invasion response regulator UvrY
MTSTSTLKILLVDDHAIVRRGVRHLLIESWPTAVFGEATTAQEALELVWKEPWSVVILDITMPDRSGLDIIGELREAQPKMPVLVLSMHAEEQFALRMFKSGASGYVTKDTLLEDLTLAVEKMLAGGRYLSPSLAEILAGVMAGADQVPHQRLSDREFQVMLMLVRGMAVKEIGAKLSLSVNTISTYRMRTLEKMNMQSTAELVQYSIQHELL